MGIIRLSISKIRFNALETGISVWLFALGIGMMSLVILMERNIREQFSKNLAGIDLVAGAKGSPMQLLLSTVFHLDTPTGNIRVSEAEMITGNPLVEKTIPISLGDSYQGFRIVGTTPAYGDLYQASLAAGSWFDVPFEAVAGAEVAKRTGITSGDHIAGRHGFSDHGHLHDEDLYVITGVLQPTGTIIDRLILTSVETYQLIHSHPAHSEDHDSEHDHHGEVHPGHDPDIEKHDVDVGDDQAGHHHTHTEACDHDDEEHQWQILIEKLDAREDLSMEEMELYRKRSGQLQEKPSDPSGQITALLIFYRSPMAAIQLPRLINEQTRMQAASPALEMHRLFSLIGNGVNALRWLAWIIIIISAVNIFIHLSGTLHRELGEIALIRTLGASRIKVMMLLILQGIWIALAGWLAGWFLSRIIMPFLPGTSIMGDSLPVFALHDFWLLVYAIAAGILAAIVPAIKAYRSDIHHHLNKV